MLSSNALAPQNRVIPAPAAAEAQSAYDAVAAVLLPALRSRSTDPMPHIASSPHVLSRSATNADVYPYQSLSSPALVSALNALALIFAVTTRQDDALDQLEKIAYQASRSPASPALTSSSSPQTSRIRNASLSTPSSPISPSHQHNNFFGAAHESDVVLTLRTPAVQLLCAVLGFLKGALRRAGPPGTLRGRAPLGGAQAYAAAKGKLNVGVAGWDRGIRGWDGDE